MDMCNRFIPKMRKPVILFQIKCADTQRRLVKQKPTQHRLSKLTQQENYVQSLISASNKLAYKEKVVNSQDNDPSKLYGYLKLQSLAGQLLVL